MGVAVTFDDDNVSVHVAPGGRATCSLRVQNTGMTVDGVLLDVLGDVGDWASVEPGEVNLLPGASAPVTVVFAPPRSAALAPGLVPFGLRAMSREDPDGSQIEEGTVQVEEFSDLGVSLVPKSATGRRSARFRLIVENRGNRPEHLMVDASDADVKLAFRARPETFTAPPGAATFVRFTAVPRKTFFKGPNRSLPFEVSVHPDDGDPVAADGVMLERQILPGWLLPVLGVALALAAVIIALWFVVLRPVVHSAATAAADAGHAAKSAKSAAGSASQAASSHAIPPASPSALDVSVTSGTILTSSTELATVTGSFKSTGGGTLPTLVWTSSNPKVATVSQTGVVTGVSAGSATITATGQAKASATPSPTPSPPTSASPGPGPGPSPDATQPPGPTPSDTTSSTLTAARSSVISGSVTVNVVAKVAVSSTVLPEAAVGKSYSASLSAAGGTGAFTWSVSKGSLPAGLSLTPGTGAISGTPTKLGSISFTVHVADAGPPTQFATGVVTIAMVKPLAISTSALPGAAVGVKYSQALAAIGGTPPYSWSVSPGSGNLPAGLALDPATGAITGTPTTSGTSSFVVQVADSAKPSQTSTESLSITVTGPLELTTLSLPTAVLDTRYSQMLAGLGGSQPYTWSISTGSLPVGLTLSPTTGVISGTPTTAGSSTFSIGLADSSHPALLATGTFTITVVSSLVAMTSQLPSGQVGQSYTTQLVASGGIKPYVWSVDGTLPPGLKLAPSGAITGTPTATGMFPFTVQAVDSSSPPLSVTATLSVTVVSPLQITTTSLPEAVTGTSYSQTEQATGGTQPYTWSVSAGNLPLGLSLSPSTGAITGTALSAGTSAFTISVKDAGTPTSHVASLSTSIAVVEPLSFTEPNLPDAVQGVSYGDVTPGHLNGGSGTYGWSITSGALPAGLSLDPSTGTISGTTSASAALGAQNFTLTMADAATPSLTDSQAETITVFAPLQVTAPQLSATSGATFSQNLNSFVTGGRAPYTFTASSIGNLSVDSATGVISGTPDAPCPGGGSAQSVGSSIEVQCPSSFDTESLTVTDANGNSITVPMSLTLTVAPMIFDPVSSLPDISDGDNYSQQTVVNGMAPTGGYGPSQNDIGGFSFATSKVSTSGAKPIHDNNGLPCNQVGCSGLAGTAQLNIDSSTGEISGSLGDVIHGQEWTFKVTITDVDPLSPGNTITASFQLSITAA